MIKNQISVMLDLMLAKAALLQYCVNQCAIDNFV